MSLVNIKEEEAPFVVPCGAGLYANVIKGNRMFQF